VQQLSAAIVGKSIERSAPDDRAVVLGTTKRSISISSRSGAPRQHAFGFKRFDDREDAARRHGGVAPELASSAAAPWSRAVAVNNSSRARRRCDGKQVRALSDPVVAPRGSLFKEGSA
jgi:hypothetical protein